MSYKDLLSCMTNAQIMRAKRKTVKVVRDSYRQCRPLQAQANQEIVELYDEVLEDRWLRVAPPVRLEVDRGSVSVIIPAHRPTFEAFRDGTILYECRS